MATVTIGTQTFTVYADDVAAGNYFIGRMGGYQWTGYASPQGSGETTNDLKRALVTATNLLNKQPWQGTPTSGSNVPLAWPRTGVVANGIAIDSATIPQDIINGSFELALAILLDPTTVLGNANGTTDNVKVAKAGSAMIEQFRPVLGTRLPTAVTDWIAPYQGGPSAAGPNSIAGDPGSDDDNDGDNDESTFDDDNWSILRGL